MLETSRYPGLRPNLTGIMLAWCILVFIEFTFFVLISRSAFHSRELPLGALLLLFSESVTLLTIVTFVIGAALATGGIAIQRYFSPGPRTIWIIRFLGTSLVWLGLIVYGASWSLFWQTGSFIGKQVFIFLAPHPLQVFHWVDFDIACAIVAVAGVGAFVLTVAIPQLGRGAFVNGSAPVIAKRQPSDSCFCHRRAARLRVQPRRRSQIHKGWDRLY